MVTKGRIVKKSTFNAVSQVFAGHMNRQKLSCIELKFPGKVDDTLEFHFRASVVVATGRGNDRHIFTDEFNGIFVVLSAEFSAEREIVKYWEKRKGRQFLRML